MADQNIRVTSSSLRLDRPEENLADETMAVLAFQGPGGDLVAAAKAYEALKKHQQAKRERS